MDDTIKLESLSSSPAASMLRVNLAELPQVDIAAVRDRNLILERAARRSQLACEFLSARVGDCDARVVYLWTAIAGVDFV